MLRLADGKGDGPRRAPSTRQRILEAMRDDTTSVELATRINAALSTVQEMIRKLRVEGRVEAVGQIRDRGHPKTVWRRTT